MATMRSNYSAEEKKQIILDVLSRKTNIQKIAAQKGIAPTLISLWKKQAEDAMLARFQPQPRGRRKAVKATESAPKVGVVALKAELRKTRTKLTRQETALKKAQTKLAALESGVTAMAAAMGCKLRKAPKARKA